MLAKRALAFLTPLVIAGGLFAFAPAGGQGNPTCPTRPSGDSSNACASTAFVQNVSGGVIALLSQQRGGSGTVNSGTAGQLGWYATTGTAISGNANISWVSATGLTIAPTASTTNQGFNITQSTPNTTPTGPLALNKIAITNQSNITLPNTLTNGMSNNQIHGLWVDVSDTGVSSVTSAITAHLSLTSGSPSGDKIGVHANVYTTQSIPSYFLGVDSVTSVDGAANVDSLISEQTETWFYGSGTATKAGGLEISRGGVGNGSSFDAALWIDSVAGSSWKKGITFGSPASGALSATAACVYTGCPSIDPSGDLFYAYDTMSVTNVLNFTNLTVTGAFVN